MSDPNDPNDPSDQPQEQPAAICGESMMTGAWAPAADDIPDRVPTEEED